MADFHLHRDHYYNAPVANEWIKDELGEVQEENPKVGPEEYHVTDYEGENSKEELNKNEETRGILSDHQSLGVTLNQNIAQEDPTDDLLSLEEEVATLKKQLLAAEARVVQAEQRVDEITRETSEMAELIGRYFGIGASLHYPH